jgi:hypothetical protein
MLAVGSHGAAGNIGALNLKYHFDITDLTSTTPYWTRDKGVRKDGAQEIAHAIGQ